MVRTAACVLFAVAVAGCSGSNPAPQTSGDESASPPSATDAAAAAPEDGTSFELSLPQQPALRPAPRPAAQPESAPATGQRNRPLASLDPAELARVHDLTERFYDGDVEGVFESFSDEMKRTLGLEQLRELHDRVSQSYGSETEIIAEEAAVNNDIRAFVRWARFDKTADVIQLEWYLHPDDSVAGFFIEPAKRPPEAGRQP